MDWPVVESDEPETIIAISAVRSQIAFSAGETFLAGEAVYQTDDGPP